MFDCEGWLLSPIHVDEKINKLETTNYGEIKLLFKNIFKPTYLSSLMF